MTQNGWKYHRNIGLKLAEVQFLSQQNVTSLRDLILMKSLRFHNLNSVMSRWTQQGQPLWIFWLCFPPQKKTLDLIDFKPSQTISSFHLFRLAFGNSSNPWLKLQIFNNIFKAAVFHFCPHPRFQQKFHLSVDHLFRAVESEWKNDIEGNQTVKTILFIKSWINMSTCRKILPYIPG